MRDEEWGNKVRWGLTWGEVRWGKGREAVVVSVSEFLWVMTRIGEGERRTGEREEMLPSGALSVGRCFCCWWCTCCWCVHWCSLLAGPIDFWFMIQLSLFFTFMSLVPRSDFHLICIHSFIWRLDLGFYSVDVVVCIVFVLTVLRIVCFVMLYSFKLLFLFFLSL